MSEHDRKVVSLDGDVIHLVDCYRDLDGEWTEDPERQICMTFDEFDAIHATVARWYTMRKGKHTT